jgi:thiosulfate reductase cytochrome b subunit
MSEIHWDLGQVTPIAVRADAPRHHAVVRVTHWLTALCFVALLVSGMEIVISHPRFYWGENGNVLTPALFSLPIPSSRDTVPTAYGYVLPDQNGWSRSLHFEAGWVLVFTGAVYVMFGVFSGHFRKNLLPDAVDPSAHSRSYNRLQRITYLTVILVLFPLMIWTGLAMSPAFVSVMPSAVSVLGGRQSARTLHFLVSLSLVLFLLVHVAMVWRAGFKRLVMEMIAGRARAPWRPE